MPDTRPKPFIFVLMPFDSEFDDIYRVGIKTACENSGAYAERVDEQIFKESILQRIFNQIAKADIIISDMTNRNPNVFYETGYAHALGKNVVLITQNSEDIPFDLKHFPHIIYKGRIVDLIPELQKRVRWFIENPSLKLEEKIVNLEFQINDIPVVNNPTIDIITEQKIAQIDLIIDMHNSIIKEIKPIEFQIGFQTPDILSESMKTVGRNIKWFKVINVQNDLRLHLPGDTFTVLPGGWEKYNFRFITRSPLQAGMSFNISIKVFTTYGCTEYPFILRLSRKLTTA